MVTLAPSSNAYQPVELIVHDIPVGVVYDPLVKEKELVSTAGVKDDEPPLGALDIQAVPFDVSTFPELPALAGIATPLVLATVGLGYVPDRSPPAEPEGATPPGGL